MRNVDTFFRGHRRETFIDGATILCNSAGEKRLKLSMKIPLTGDQLVGMPTWVEGPFVDISKPDFALKSPISSDMELDPMVLRVFGLPEGQLPLGDQDALITFDGVRMCSFKIQRDDDISLTFTAYLPRTGMFLAFADENFKSSLYVVYEAAQPSLLDANPNVQPNDPAPDDEEDDDDDDDDDELEDEQEDEDEDDDDEEEEEEQEQAAPVKPIKEKKPRTITGKRNGYGKPIAAIQ